MSTCEEIGARLKQLREQKQMTQAQLAEKMNTSREAINLWERGARDMKTGTVCALAKIFDVSCDYILQGIDSCNISTIKTLGISNSAINYLKNLKRNAVCQNIAAQEQLIAIDGLLNSKYENILYELYSFFVTDFSKPTFIQFIEENTIESNMDPYLLSFPKHHSTTPQVDSKSYLEISEDIFEAAYFDHLMSKIKEAKFYIYLEEKK